MLWNSTNCAEWTKSLKQYDTLLQAHEVNELDKIDAWYRGELPTLLASRKPPSVTKDEFLEILRWKMKRGDWREYNRIRIVNTDARTIKKAAQDGLTAARDLDPDVPTASKDYKAPIQLICTLDGVGPATASAVLTPLRPDLYPFFDEWIGKQIEGLGKVAFTPGYYWKYADALRNKAKELNEMCGEGWNAQEVGQALWVASGGKIKVK